VKTAKSRKYDQVAKLNLDREVGKCSKAVEMETLVLQIKHA